MHEVPFPLNLVMIEIKGKFVKEALEQHIIKYPAQVGSYPHVSKGSSAIRGRRQRLTTQKRHRGARRWVPLPRPPSGGAVAAVSERLASAARGLGRRPPRVPAALVHPV